MTIYYFVKQRFPRKDKRGELARIFDEEGKIPDEILEDSDFFRPFKLKLPSNTERINKLHNLNYEMLEEYKTSFDLRTVRNMIIKQNHPSEDDSSIYEIFNRLNSGGLNLKPQEIRSSLYQSHFDNMLKKINLDPRWRSLIGQENPDLRLKDIEILLRAFAMLYKGDQYKSPMIKFLNQFASKGRGFTKEEVLYLQELFLSFLDQCTHLDDDIFLNSQRKFNISVFESVFNATSAPYLEKQSIVTKPIDNDAINRLKQDPAFINATQSATASKDKVQDRLLMARDIIGHS
ncbi:hypothetical protein JCM19055_4870 [Geomicrobium sp. JCM 19055]|nr:hypothetical protein JCM19055_4870 [Geomicrobium sp. JCM 19055]